MIIICHIFQYLDIELAWWFNTGVQMFLCISGYLYGQKHIGEIREFYLRRFRKICVPFYIVLIPAVMINFFFKKISLLTVGRALVMNATFPGAGHLWFVPTILFCYAVTPILESFYTKVSRRGYFFATLFAIEITALFCFGFADFYNGAWIGCYVIGYAIGINENKSFLSKKILLILFGALASLNLIQIYIEYIVKIEVSGTIGKMYSAFRMYNHVWLGVFLCLLLKTVFDKFEFSKKMRRILDITDMYSYETYLVHQFLILGPFSLMALTPFLVLNIFVILICIGILAWILRQIEMRAFKMIL